MIGHYLGKISGPLLDRIDLPIKVPAVPFQELAVLPDTPAGRAWGLEVYRKHVAGAPVTRWPLEFRRKHGRPVWRNVWNRPTLPRLLEYP